MIEFLFIKETFERVENVIIIDQYRNWKTADHLDISQEALKYRIIEFYKKTARQLSLQGNIFL